MSKRITALAGPVWGPGVPQIGPGTMYALGASGRVWTWQENHPEKRVTVAAWGRNAVRLSDGSGPPCAILRTGRTSCLWSSAPTSKAVLIPGAPTPVSFSVDGPSIGMTDRLGRPYLWTRYRGRLSTLRPQGLPARVVALTLADTTHAYTVDTSGTVRAHWFGGQPSEVVQRNAGAHYRVGVADAGVDGYTGRPYTYGPAHTPFRPRVRRVSGRTLLSADGRIWTMGVDQIDPVRGFGG